MKIPNAKRFAAYGPGGRYCVCCGPSPSNRKKHDRLIKRRQKRYIAKEIKKELSDS